MNYLRRATGDLRATAEVNRTGSSIGVSDVVVTSTVLDDEAGCGEKEVTTGQPSYRLFR